MYAPFSVFNKDGPLTADEEEQFLIARGKMLGNIKFIGELGKNGDASRGHPPSVHQTAVGEEKEGPYRGHVGEHGMPLSDNEDRWKAP